jgi:diguanylate cyclase (GGDEF)-like protein
MNFKFQSKTQELLPVLLIAFFVSGLTIATSYLRGFQFLECLTYDTWFRLRSPEEKEKRIVVVTISESDIRKLGKWPISDNTLSELVTNIDRQQPRVIGLDLYRDLPIEPGTRKLETVLRSTHNLIGIEKVIGEAVQPSPILKQEDRVAFADLIRDSDGKIRRGLLSIELDNGQIQFGLATRLALMYLAREKIEPQVINNTGKLALGKGQVIPFKRNDGGYINADDGGFQVLINYRGTETSFDRISISDVLNKQIPPDLMRDRIVLVGSIAQSLNDFFPTPYSKTREDRGQDLSGVFIHANIVSQIISGALDGRGSIKTVREPWEWIWIFVWTCDVLIINVALRNRQFSFKLVLFNSTILAIIISGIAMLGSSYLLFLYGFWLPVISPLFSLIVYGVIINWYYKQAEEKHQQKLALTDGLTVIPNRRFFDQFLTQQWQQYKQKKQSLSIILCDVDFFKKYNDTYGHQAGDLCLQQVAGVLAQSIRKTDLAARYGGEEFAVVLPNTPPEAAMEIAQRICDRLKSLQIPHATSQASKYVSLSCGVASTNVNSVNSPEELIGYADRALYKAKEQGRDRAILW